MKTLRFITIALVVSFVFSGNSFASDTNKGSSIPERSGVWEINRTCPFYQKGHIKAHVSGSDLDRLSPMAEIQNEFAVNCWYASLNFLYARIQPEDAEESRENLFRWNMRMGRLISKDVYNGLFENIIFLTGFDNTNFLEDNDAGMILGIRRNMYTYGLSQVHAGLFYRHNLENDKAGFQLEGEWVHRAETNNWFGTRLHGTIISNGKLNPETEEAEWYFTGGASITVDVLYGLSPKEANRGVLNFETGIVYNLPQNSEYKQAFVHWGVSSFF